MAGCGKPKREQTDVGESGVGCKTLSERKPYVLFPILVVMYATKQLHRGVNDNQDGHTTAGIECRGDLPGVVSTRRMPSMVLSVQGESWVCGVCL